MANTKNSPKKTRDELTKAIHELQVKAMGPGIPSPQRTALKNRSQELRDQLIELEAARFNQETANYKSAINHLETSIADLRKGIKEIDDMIKVVDKAGIVFVAMDKLLKLAVTNLPIVV